MPKHKFICDRHTRVAGSALQSNCTIQWGVQHMRHVSLMMAAGLLAGALAGTPAEAKSCFKKAAVGDALTQDLAKFQVDAMLLQSTDWSIYFTYISSGTTPGYTFGKRSYQCAPGSVGWECRGSATLCKL